jgi:hypothetical protein
MYNNGLEDHPGKLSRQAPQASRGGSLRASRAVLVRLERKPSVESLEAAATAGKGHSVVLPAPGATHFRVVFPTNQFDYSGLRGGKRVCTGVEGGVWGKEMAPDQ